jgi:broad specificity phosphatase PhoE
VVAEIVIVRHGETEWSMSGQHTSNTDLSLTDEGRRRAALLEPQLAKRSFSVVLTSPLRRARETCELAGFGDQAAISDDLREWEYGDYEGLTTPEIRQQNPSWNLWRDGCPGGESPEQVCRRADRVLERLREADSEALVFAHGHILRVLAARWLRMETAAGARFVLGAGACGVLGFERETEVLALWNANPAGTA